METQDKLIELKARVADIAKDMEAELGSHEVSLSKTGRSLEDALDAAAVENVVARLQETIRLLPDLSGDFNSRLAKLRGRLIAMRQSQ